MSIKPIVFVFLFAGLFYNCSKSPEKESIPNNKSNTNKLEEKARPSDYWEDKWRYPSTKSQAGNFKKAIQIAKKTLLFK